VSQNHANHRYPLAGEAAEAVRTAEGQGAGQGESTRFRSATAEPLASRTGTKQTSGTTPHTGWALGNLNLIGSVWGRKLALSAPAPGYKELEVQVKEVPIWQKSNLTLEEAAAYSGIGINKLRSMTDSDECKFVLWNGTKRLIKRRKLDEYLDTAFSI
ncbi:excisionase, partial [Faecalibacterium prausnitzii]|uniref:excisionase n=1 Tax=Faecalibacterium prausnitzii TaxID=853 RepID=UPI003F1C2844